MSKQINLEELILLKHGCNSREQLIANYSLNNESDFNLLIASIKYCCSKILELASENALIQEQLLINKKVVAIRESTILEARFIKDSERIVSVNKESILNAINQIV